MGRTNDTDICVQLGFTLGTFLVFMVSAAALVLAIYGVTKSGTQGPVGPIGPTGPAGSGSTNVNLGAVTAYPNQTWSVYVRMNGNDVTGTGSISFPFLTITRAMASITDATPSLINNPPSSQYKRYVINVGPGQYNEAPISLKANVMIDGADDLTTRLNCDFNLNDPSWFDPTGSIDTRSGMYDVVLRGANLVFDFNVQQSGAGKLYFWNVRSNNALHFNCYRSINQYLIQDSLVFSDVAISGCNGQIFSSTINGDLIMTSNPNTPTTIQVRDGGIEGSLSVTYTAGHGTPVITELFNTQVVTAVTGSGSAVQILATPSSLPFQSAITLTGGAMLIPSGPPFSQHITVTGSTIGSNIVTLIYPFASSNYHISYSQTSASGTPSVLTFPTRTISSFTFVDNVGSANFDFLITYV